MAKLTIRFEIRKDKINKDGYAPISCMLSIAQQRKRVTTSLRVPPINWDTENQEAVYVKIGKNSNQSFLMKSDVSRTNSLIDSIRSKFIFIEDSFKHSGKNYSVEDVFAEYNKSKLGTGIKAQKVEASKSSVVVFIDEYIERNKAIRAKRSLGVYSQLQRHLERFQHHSGKKVTFDCIRLSFFEEFQSYLIEETEINNITIAKQLSTLKTVLGYARRDGVQMDQSYRDFKIKKQKLEVITLTEGEYQSIKNVDLNGVSRHEKARDIFIFLCATSMRYSDYAQFRREHIKGQTIQLTMKKGSKPWGIPLNSDSISILEKYKELEKPLPSISNQKLSKYIKEVCQIAGIDTPIEIVRFRGSEPIKTVHPKYKLISAHTGRKTFCTLSLERGASVEMVMEWSGHESYSSFKRYVNLSKRHSISQMGKIWGEATVMKAS
ncbi:site-specific integrase [Algoriphagus sediminis]|uniref:Site-specific integrase n=1 Tax=Algoriphagus sediminis TaxID=3057113 RepID=A0ABT7YHC6_9BACT|nr:site-specific integrase [Algoriphagus sediminis]MDN3205929.1 site-specific integrase [Algoriphagus sediminis]